MYINTFLSVELSPLSVRMSEPFFEFNSTISTLILPKSSTIMAKTQTHKFAQNMSKQ